MKIYIKTRQQPVPVSINFSMWEEIISGVLHGSILGRLHFNIFLNELTVVVKNSDLSNYVYDKYVI